MELQFSYPVFWENTYFKQDFLQQLQKDLKLPTNLIIENLPEKLDEYYSLVLPFLQSAFLDKVLWKSIINRVDLNEKQLNNLKNFDGIYFDNLCKAMVLRVLQKVAIKWTLK